MGIELSSQNPNSGLHFTLYDTVQKPLLMQYEDTLTYSYKISYMLVKILLHWSKKGRKK
jgi:hypothetical protein